MSQFLRLSRAQYSLTIRVVSWRNYLGHIAIRYQGMRDNAEWDLGVQP
jgi:hypothetical protein